MNFKTKEGSYFIGFAQCDGHLSKQTRNRGKLSIELNVIDKPLLQKLGNISQVNYSLTTRTRSTNFKPISTSTTLSIYDLNFRTKLNEAGVPYGAKSEIIKKPKNVIEKDYFRGIIDADGSLGFKKNGTPYLSFCTKSEELAKDVVAFFKKTTTKDKVLNRNKRDQIFNIVILAEDAKKVITTLYYKNCLCLDRKLETAKEIKNWTRPSNMKKNNFIKKSWTSEEDEFIKKNDLKTCIEKLKRTEQSIKTRLWRIK